ncbi:MAG: ABC transporter ATP-binding protein, partial [Stappiaceae bacterium]
HATDTLVRVGLGEYLHDYPHVLSGGEQQRVALARALAPKPSVLLMDEPFSGLDRRLRDRVRFETLEILRNSGATCIIVTHDPEEAMQVADRIALMHEGKLVQVGNPEEIYLNPVSPFAARFFSDLNEMECPLVDHKVMSPFGPISADSITEGEKAWVGIRPHDLELVEDGAGKGATVINHRFLGELDSVKIQLDGTDETIQLRLPTRGGQSWPERINLALKSGRALIFNLPSLEQ